MSTKLIKYIVITLIAAIGFGCDYQQEDKLAPGSVITPIGVIGGLDANGLTEPLQAFYDEFLVVKNDGQRVVDTEVDYQKMLDLYNAKDPEYMDRVAKIKEFIALANLSRASYFDKKAFYINAYNFLIINLIVEKSGDQLVSSVLDIEGLNFNVFSKKFFTVSGFSENPSIALHNKGQEISNAAVSLDDIEKVMLLKVLQDTKSDYAIGDSDPSNDDDNDEYLDARIHFAVICASKGCPVLYPEVFTGDKVEEQLDEATRIGLRQERVFNTVSASKAHPDGLYEEGDSITRISKIFFWYWNDFELYALEQLDVSGFDVWEILEGFRDHFLSAEEKEELFLEHLISKDKINQNAELIDYSWKLNKVEN